MGGLGLTNHDLTDQQRTLRELTKARSALVSYIQFEGEESSMFVSNKLPTLDTNLWWNESCVMYDFYEKPTCPNRVIQK